jgi:hypothetical protein
MLVALHTLEERRAADLRALALTVGALDRSSLAERFESAYNATLARRTALRRQTERKAPLSQSNGSTLSGSARNSSFTESRSA